LGQEWNELTGLPFVYAVWVAKSGSKIHGLSKLLIDARECGMRSLGEIADAEAARLGMEKERCLWYLNESIKYNLGEQEIQGLRSYYDYAVEMGEVKEEIKLEFYDE
jgi:Predicted periplasmic solute-binding protein